MGLVVACGTLAAQRLALVLQCWVAHPDRDVESARAFIGFMVGVVPHLPLAVGMVLLGVTAHRRYLLARVARRALLVGMLVLPSLVLAAYLQDVVSTGGWKVGPGIDSDPGAACPGLGPAGMASVVTIAHLNPKRVTQTSLSGCARSGERRHRSPLRREVWPPRSGCYPYPTKPA